MKKRIISTFLAVALLFSMVITSTAAAETRANGWAPTLSFDKTTANCFVSVAAIGEPITATLELWHGETCIASWSHSATSRLIIDEDCKVTPGQTYTLKVSGTIDGVPFTGTPITGTCPK